MFQTTRVTREAADGDPLIHRMGCLAYRAALKSCARAGFVDIGPIWRFGFGPMMFTLTPEPGRREGIRFGRRADLTPRGIRLSASGGGPPSPHAAQIIQGRSRRRALLRAFFKS